MLARTRAISTFLCDKQTRRSRIALVSSSNLWTFFSEFEEAQILKCPTNNSSEFWLVYSGLKNGITYFGIQLPLINNKDYQIASCFLIKELGISNCLFISSGATLSPELFPSEWIVANRLYNFNATNKLFHSPLFFPKQKYIVPENQFSKVSNEGIRYFMKHLGVEIIEGSITQCDSAQIIQQSFPYFPSKAWVTDTCELFSSCSYFDIELSCILKVQLTNTYLEGRFPLVLNKEERQAILQFITCDNWK